MCDARRRRSSGFLIDRMGTLAYRPVTAANLNNCDQIQRSRHTIWYDASSRVCKDQ